MANMMADLKRAAGRAWSCVAALALAGAAQGQDLGVPAPKQPGPIAIVGATVHPVSAAPIERGYVLFDGGKIVEVGAMVPGKSFAPGTTVVDGAGKHVWPGMISPYTRLGLTEMGATRPSHDFNETGEVTPEALPSVAVNPDSTLIPVARANGVLAAGVFPAAGIIPGRVSVITTEGWTTEDLTLRRDAGLLVSWPMMRAIRAPWMDQSDEQQATRTRESLERIRETFRTARAYLALKQADADGTPTDIRWEAMRPALEGKAPTFIEAADYDQIVSAVGFAREFGLKPVIVGGRDAALCAGLLKAHDVPVIFNSVINMPRRDDSAYDEAYATPARLLAAGVRFCLASGEETPHERNVPYAAAMAAAHGLDAEAAYRSVSLWAAEILGVADRVGSLEAGKDATLVIATGNPLEVTTKVEGAYIQGRRVSVRSKQNDLADKYREKYRQLGGPGAAPGKAPAGGAK